MVLEASFAVLAVVVVLGLCSAREVRPRDNISEGVGFGFGLLESGQSKSISSVCTRLRASRAVDGSGVSRRDRWR